MRIVTQRHLNEAAATYQETAKELAAWVMIASTARWQSFVELRATFPDADMVDGYVIFNIRHNRYRLVTVVHFAKQVGDRLTMGHVYIFSFLTHKEYDNPANWDRRPK